MDLIIRDKSVAHAQQQQTDERDRGDYHEEFKSNPTRQGDSFGNEFLLRDDEPNGHMVGEWVVQPGAEGKAMGDQGQNDTVTIDISESPEQS